MNAHLTNTLIASTSALLATFFLSSSAYAKTIVLTSFEETVQTYAGPNSSVNIQTVSSPVRAGSWALQVNSNINDYGGSYLSLSGEKADWSTASSVSMWVYGNNSGQTFYVIVEDDQHEQLWYAVNVNWSGWQQVTIPIGSFGSRTDWQPDGAIVNGTIESPVRSLHLAAFPYGSGNRNVTLTFDMLQLNTPAGSNVLTSFEETVQAYSGPNSSVSIQTVSSPVHDGLWALQVNNNINDYGGSYLSLSGEKAFWSTAASVSMWVNGNNSGQTYYVIVEDDQHEQLWYSIKLNWSGWRQVTIPIGSFTSRTDWQPDGAVVNGAIDSPVRSLHLAAFPNGSGNRSATLTFDQLELSVRDVELVSISSEGAQANAVSRWTGISEHGRYVAFSSGANNLVPNDTNSAFDVFVRDRYTGQTTRVSVASDGTQGNGHSDYPSITADGRYVLFGSDATNLVPNDTNGAYDMFIHDRATHQTRRVLDALGIQANSDSWIAVLSPDGRYVVFNSWADNLVPNDTNHMRDVFVYDMSLNSLELVSVASDGTQGNDQSLNAVLSADGRYVAFESDATNLVPNDTNGVGDIFVHDRVTKQTRRVSVDDSGAQANGESWAPSISADGRYIAYLSSATNLVGGDTNGARDVFVYDALLAKTTRASVDSNGVEGNSESGSGTIFSFLHMSADGQMVFFVSTATNLVAGDTNGFDDIFMHNLRNGQTSRVSLTYTGAQANGGSIDPIVSADGRFLVFCSVATNLVPGDTNGVDDLFVRYLK